MEREGSVENSNRPDNSEKLRKKKILTAQEDERERNV